MPQAFAPVRPAAPIQSANDAATSPDLIQLHLAACNALAQALHTLRTSDCTAKDLSRAISRARRGLTNIKRMTMNLELHPDAAIALVQALLAASREANFTRLESLTGKGAK